MSTGPERSITARYLERIGVRETPRATCPFDPGYDLATLEGHMEQSGHLMGSVKISMACWMVAAESVSRRKIRAVTRLGIPAVAGGGPFEVAVAQHALPAYLDLCADMGITRIECGEGFTGLKLRPEEVVGCSRLRLVFSSFASLSRRRWSSQRSTTTALSQSAMGFPSDEDLTPGELQEPCRGPPTAQPRGRAAFAQAPLTVDGEGSRKRFLALRPGEGTAARARRVPRRRGSPRL